jgi:hypothetical protein
VFESAGVPVDRVTIDDKDVHLVLSSREKQFVAQDLLGDFIAINPCIWAVSFLKGEKTALTRN